MVKELMKIGQSFKDKKVGKISQKRKISTENLHQNVRFQGSFQVQFLHYRPHRHLPGLYPLSYQQDHSVSSGGMG